MQTKTKSLIESLSNVAVRLPLSIVSAYFIIPFLFDADPSLPNSVWMTLYFTIQSITISYILRRVFNRSEKIRIHDDFDIGKMMIEDGKRATEYGRNNLPFTQGSGIKRSKDTLIYLHRKNR